MKHSTEAKKKESLEALGRTMRSNATGVNYCFEQMEAIDRIAAAKALDGIIQYLQEKKETMFA